MKDQNLKSKILVSMMETLQKHLPLIAEEGGIREKVSAEFLSERLSEGGMVAPEAVQAYLKLVEEFFLRFQHYLLVAIPKKSFILIFG